MRALASALVLVSATPALAQSNAAAATDTASADGGAATVLVIPYQPIYRSADASKADTATKYLNDELDNKESLRVLRAGVAIPGQAAPSMDAVEAAEKEAETAEAEHHMRDAIDARKAVIAAMTNNASALPDADRFILAHHLLARVQLWAGDDERAMATMTTAATMAPNMELPPSAFSRLYRARFAALRSELRKANDGSLLVRSVIPGAQISIDGREAGVAPVRLVDVLPGRHLIGATAPGVSPSMAVVDVAPGASAEVTMAFGNTVGGPSVGRVADALAENALPSAAIAAAKQAGEAASARWVVLGGLAKDVDHFNVHTFVLDVGSGKVSKLEVAQFDLDLLTAASDVLRVVLEVEKSIASFDGQLSDVAQVESKARPVAVVSEVDGGPDLAQRRRATPTRPKAPASRKPLKARNDLDIRD